MFYAEKLVSYSENSNNYYSQDRSSIPSKILLMTWLFKKRNESVSCFCNWCQIQLGISACVMSSEYVTRTSLYLDRLKIFEWVKCLRRPLHQIQENWAVRNFLTASYVNSRSLGMQEYRDESEIYKDQWIQLSNNKFINEILGAWPGLTVMYKRNNQHRTSLEFLVEAGRLDWVTKKLKYFVRCRTTILVKNLWNRNCFSWIVSKISYIHYSHLCSQLTCAPLLPLCWAMHILEHWDDCSTQINIGEGETHASEHSRFLTSIIE